MERRWGDEREKKESRERETREKEKRKGDKFRESEISQGGSGRTRKKMESEEERD